MTLKPLTISEMDHLKVDNHGRLYWKGEAVILEKKVRLQVYQIVLATIAAIGALLAGVHPFGVTLGLW